MLNTFTAGKICLQFSQQFSIDIRNFTDKTKDMEYVCEKAKTRLLKLVYKRFLRIFQTNFNSNFKNCLKTNVAIYGSRRSERFNTVE